MKVPMRLFPRPSRSMLRHAILAALLGFAPLPALAQDAPVQSSPFSEAERAALHAEIRAYLIEHPELVMEMIQILEQKQQAATAEGDIDLVARNTDAIFDDGFSWVGGNPDGSLTIVEFLDYQCGYCRKAQPDIKALLELDGDIRLIVKEMPILGPGSELAARAAIATLIAKGPEAYGALHDRLMAVQGPIDDAGLDRVLVAADLDPAEIRAGMADPEVSRRLAETRALGETLAISGTPTFVVDNRMVRGYLPLPQMQELVAALRVDN